MSMIKVSFSATMTEAQYEEFEKKFIDLGLFVSKIEDIEHIKLDLVGGATEDPKQTTIGDLPKKKGTGRTEYRELWLDTDSNNTKKRRKS